MDKEVILSTITEIGVCEDDATRRTMLAGLGDSVSELFDNIETLNNNNQTLLNDNESLRKTNMDMFLRLGAQRSHTEEPPQVETPKRKIEDLFNEKGVLK